ncbi:hypothetical protein PH7735_02859 [Shimia thalassica]|uniref:Uncharacterized protein n=1 Tax=Shimia thalassica TaxID=1715693 RepID=A0A0P1IIZ4_9RHOB|nr:hypothetical protein PH7735_02859 [Shimia thalassica]
MDNCPGRVVAVVETTSSAPMNCSVSSDRNSKLLGSWAEVVKMLQKLFSGDLV